MYTESLLYRQDTVLKEVFCFQSSSLLIWTFFIAVAVKVIPYFDWI